MASSFGVGSARIQALGPVLASNGGPSTVPASRHCAAAPAHSGVATPVSSAFCHPGPLRTPGPCPMVRVPPLMKQTWPPRWRAMRAGRGNAGPACHTSAGRAAIFQPHPTAPATGAPRLAWPRRSTAVHGFTGSNGAGGPFATRRLLLPRHSPPGTPRRDLQCKTAAPPMLPLHTASVAFPARESHGQTQHLHPKRRRRRDPPVALFPRQWHPGACKCA